ncbi:hypothetical protein CALVIDRAFT_536196 [Calocera viscosa TUFC12733]|uniref:Uncharacterized protein n=1 Tax=Calocera viscosa (strain TUFC12733) TaxID=1330018 RepID=A0A167NE35_CALVF|nr:hypothetical protein CALVIDRAFT_536196 [Calocera viscosa TUFC12733]
MRNSLPLPCSHLGITPPPSLTVNPAITPLQIGHSPQHTTFVTPDSSAQPLDACVRRLSLGSDGVRVL